MMTRRYFGRIIRECDYQPGLHGGRWYVQSYHHTGLPWDDRDSTHYLTLAAAKASIRDDMEQTP